MENKELTPFDSLVSDHRLQILKAAIPYIQPSQQRVLSLYVKFLEFSNTIQLVHTDDSQLLSMCSVQTGKNPSSGDMLNAIKQYCTNEEKEMIDLVMNFLHASQLYNTYQDSPSKPSSDKRESMNPMEALKGLLSPEQRSMFDTYSSILSASQ